MFQADKARCVHSHMTTQLNAAASICCILLVPSYTEPEVTSTIQVTLQKENLNCTSKDSVLASSTKLQVLTTIASASSWSSMISKPERNRSPSMTSPVTGPHVTKVGTRQASASASALAAAPWVDAAPCVVSQQCCGTQLGHHTLLMKSNALSLYAQNLPQLVQLCLLGAKKLNMYLALLWCTNHACVRGTRISFA